jgi:hypothetical protein
LEKPLIETSVLGNLGYIRFTGNNPPVAPLHIPVNPPSEDLPQIMKKKPPEAKLTKTKRKGSIVRL